MSSEIPSPRAPAEAGTPSEQRPSRAAILRATVKLQELRAEGRDPEECMTAALREAYAQDFAGASRLAGGSPTRPPTADGGKRR